LGSRHISALRRRLDAVSPEVNRGRRALTRQAMPAHHRSKKLPCVEIPSCVRLRVISHSPRESLTYSRNWNYMLNRISSHPTSLLAFPKTDKGRSDRRLCMSTQAAFDHACDDGELIAATELLAILEIVRLRSPPAPSQREAAIEPLITSYVRLWRRKNEMQRRRTSDSGEDREAIDMQSAGAIAIGAR
jgi:hypothetical protein